jgi:hypothetical protein
MSTVDNNANTPTLAALPEELCMAIVDVLDIPSLIALSQTSRQFHRLADPYDDSRRSQMREFLAKAQYFPRWLADGFACFTCTKVLPRDRFADKDMVKKRGKGNVQERKRSCIQCNMATGRLSPGSMVFQGTTLRRVCQRCRMLKGGRSCMFCNICRECDPNEFLIAVCEQRGHPGTRRRSESPREM